MFTRTYGPLYQSNAQVLISSIYSATDHWDLFGFSILKFYLLENYSKNVKV